MEESITIQEATSSIGPDLSSSSSGVSSDRPDDKTRRYDRQLRLWAKSGQQSLENARVLMISGDAVGCQSLKNLVLPGISHFTILSPSIASASDIGSNFFLVPESYGLPVAQEATKYLKELNPSVEGVARVEEPVELFNRQPEWFLGFSLIIASNLQPGFVLELSDFLWSASNNQRKSPDIPLVLVRSTGFIGEMRLQYREHCVVDSHPDTTHTLRVDTPFAALAEYAQSLDMDSMDSMDHSHVPYVVLLVKALHEFKAVHPDKKTLEWDDMEEFKQVLRKGRRQLDEENYEEAESQAYRVAQTSEIPASVQELFDDPACENVSSESKNFWILVRALRDFTQLPSSHGLLPLSASLPDMKASTSSYVQLQSLYKRKAREDVQTFSDCLVGVLKGVGLLGVGNGSVEVSRAQTPTSQSVVIDQEEVESFVKNCHGLACLKGRSWRQEIETDVKKEIILSELSAKSTAIGYYIALRASERFCSTHGRFPGQAEVNPENDEEAEDIDDMGKDTRLVEDEVRMMLRSYGYTGSELPDFLVDCIGETVRGGASCLPTAAAFIGGLVGQEVIKLITGQYIPLRSTVIIDLVQSSLEKFSL